jgi:large-conductance mechanosensitive channel
MDSFNLGVLDAVYKVIEERIPLGRWLTTLASLLIILAIIALCISYLGGEVMILLGQAPTIGVHPDWNRLLTYLVTFVVVAVFIFAMVFATRQGRAELQRQQTAEKARVEREERIANALEALTKQGLPSKRP